MATLPSTICYPRRPAPLSATLIAVALYATSLTAMAREVALAQDLASDARQATSARTPVVLFFSASYCEWCEQLEQDFLVPMLISGDYQDKVLMRKVVTDSYATIKGFDGKAVEVGRFAYDYDAYLTPTLLFVDHEGRELATRIVGLTTPEMFGGYLDQAIDSAHSSYRERATH